MGQEGDAEGPPSLFFFLFSPFSSVTCSYPARRGIVSPKSVCALTQMLVALLLYVSTTFISSLGNTCLGIPCCLAQQALTV